MPMAACPDRTTSAHWMSRTAGIQSSQSWPIKHNTLQAAREGGFCSREGVFLQEYRVALLALGSAHAELQTAQRQAGITPTQQGEQLLPDCFCCWRIRLVMHTALTRSINLL